ncbi:hypothetical protein QJS66_17660 [Kocuria rhizophila]|nr:hypothetical protein QJS66_17660 [Kocuria rhizophila]
MTRPGAADRRSTGVRVDPAQTTSGARAGRPTSGTAAAHGPAHGARAASPGRVRARRRPAGSEARTTATRAARRMAEGSPAP